VRLVDVCSFPFSYSFAHSSRCERDVFAPVASEVLFSNFSSDMGEQMDVSPSYNPGQILSTKVSSIIGKRGCQGVKISSFSKRLKKWAHSCAIDERVLKATRPRRVFDLMIGHTKVLLLFHK
jgi:hypothetical protein